MAKYSWNRSSHNSYSEMTFMLLTGLPASFNAAAGWGVRWGGVRWVEREAIFGSEGEACARALTSSKPHMELKGHSETLYCYDAEGFFVGYADIHRHLAKENDDLQQQITHLEQAQFRLSQAVEFAKGNRQGDFWTHRADIAKDVNQRLAKAKKAADAAASQPS